jgi:hypothetical protein
LIQKIREEFAVHTEFQDGDAAVIASGLKTLDQTDGVLLTLAKEEELIEADGDSSDEGKRKLMVKAVTRAYAEMGFVQTAAKQKADAASEAMRQLTATPKAQTNETTDYLIGYEIRQRLRVMTQSERMTVFAQAVADQNESIRRALANDPLQEELIPREYAERVMHEHAQQSDGTRWHRVQTLQFVSERLTLLSNALEYRLKNYGVTLTFQTPPIGKADLMMQDQTAPPEKHRTADRPPATIGRFQ